ncbi:MAG: GNAT family N-acetyltransferase [Roseibium sp.]|uniref:GNAT family N-acetyltransferase n=1 Tax=Roseibium sp. TaxID=1936156 RepID=UPI00260CA2D7|nr:GNAT family protein [Roseibium sp.]MCV0425765.1 GNAT family N-acetyltransferase [Roseibium sp.]
MPELSYPFETERLLLRPIEETDAPAIHAYQSRPEVAEYQFWDPRGLATVREKTLEWQGMRQVTGEGELALAVTLKTTGELIGDVFFKITDALARQGTVGYTLNPDFQCKGYATEAARALLNLGFGQFGLHRVFARCDARNVPSWRLMERLGMRREAHFKEHALFKGGWDEEFYYAILQREWCPKTAGSPGSRQ